MVSDTEIQTLTPPGPFSVSLFEDDATYAPLVLFEFPPGIHSEPDVHGLVLSDGSTKMSVFEANGRYGNGPGWTDVALGIIRAEMPEAERSIEMNPEGGQFAAYGARPVLERLGRLLHATYHDDVALGAAVRAAPYEYE